MADTREDTIRQALDSAMDSLTRGPGTKSARRFDEALAALDSLGADLAELSGKDSYYEAVVRSNDAQAERIMELQSELALAVDEENTAVREHDRLLGKQTIARKDLVVAEARVRELEADLANCREALALGEDLVDTLIESQPVRRTEGKGVWAFDDDYLAELKSKFTDLRSSTAPDGEAGQ